MKAFTSLTAAALVLASFHVSAADSYTASIQGCQKAISARLGASDADFSVKKIQSSPRYTELKFSVSSASASVDQLKVSCRAKQDGEVLAVNYDESALPTAVATH